MGSRYITDLADVCRAAGLSVTEVDGWTTRARGSGGYSTGAPSHLMTHHTASPASADGWSDVDYIATGSTDAPLSNLYLGRSGQVWVIAAGASNTNGTGSDPCGLVADDSMNAAAIGIEAGNAGDGSEAWPEAQQDAYRRLCVALCAAYGIPTARIHAHFEWAPSRKIDPAGPSRYATGAASWDMDAFRADCTTPPPEVEEMNGPAAVWLGHQLHQFVTGTDLAVWHTWADDFVPGVAWHPWESLGGQLLSAPAATVNGARLEVSGAGTDGALYGISWDGRAWSGWYRIADVP